MRQAKEVKRELSNLQHPFAGDPASGTEVAFSDNPLFVGETQEEQFEILTWHGYSAEVGEYRAILSRWSLNTAEKAIHLEALSIKSPYSSWRDVGSTVLPDSHKCKAREIGRERFNMGKFKRLRLYPQSPKR